jgi:PAT family beta-lactamase induction signal transducer AmpG
MNPSAPEKGASRVSNWRAYANRRTLVLVVLGFSSGLPLFLLLNLVQAWMAKSGLDIKKISLFALASQPYVWKFLWSPLMDRFNFGAFGRRRGWMAVTQLLLVGVIGAIGMLNPIEQLPQVAALAVAIAFLSASQDVAIDAYCREILTTEEQGTGAAIKVSAYKVAALVPGSLSLILADHLPWQIVFWITACFMLPGFFCSFLIAEPKAYGAPPKSLQEAVVQPFLEFFLRDGWRQALWILGFIVLFRLGDTMAATLLTKFYIDVGFKLTEIGVIAKLTLFWASMAGGIVGGIWMVRLGINRGLWVFGAIQGSTSLAFAALAYVGPIKLMLAFAVAFEAFGVGLGTTAFVAFLANNSNLRYTATQYALFSALAALPRTLFSASIGYIVAQTGWFNFYLLCFAFAIPGMLLLLKVAPWNGTPPHLEQEPQST